MRALLGLAIAVPIAAVFCVAYLTALAIESGRDAMRVPAGRARPRGQH